jgi:hypothetical protein
MQKHIDQMEGARDWTVEHDLGTEGQRCQRPVKKVGPILAIVRPGEDRGQGGIAKDDRVLKDYGMIVKNEAVPWRTGVRDQGRGNDRQNCCPGPASPCPDALMERLPGAIHGSNHRPDDAS